MKRASFFIIILAAAGHTLVCQNICFAEEKKNEPQQQVNDFSFVQYEEGGSQKWKLNGSSAEVIENTVNIERLSALSFGDATTLKLKAMQGSFDKGENLVRLRDNVVAASTDGTKLTTDYLLWNADTKNMSTEEEVNIKRPDMDITGTGAVCDMGASTAELKQDISAKFVSDEALMPDPAGARMQTIITCDGPLELNYKKNLAFFHGNVHVRDSRGDILADRIDVYFNPKTRRVKFVVARGNVKIINGDNVTYSEKAIYLVEQGRVVLPNRPKLVIQNGGTNE
ncbi:MAG: LPS export ABC transporter periplasmic protein LptC [Candidatus Omnitrophota bacterium]|nr:LPS export ABC transporter periplasmic protein LptC [Candidatus Omnitrophota bacterium]